MLSNKCSTDNDAFLMTDKDQPSNHNVVEEIWRLVRLKLLDQALLLSQSLITTNPQFAPAWHVSSVIAMQQNNYASALTDIQKALDIFPNNQHWLLQKARLLFICQQRTAARELALQLSETSNNSVAIAPNWLCY